LAKLLPSPPPQADSSRHNGGRNIHRRMRSLRSQSSVRESNLRGLPIVQSVTKREDRIAGIRAG
jgi:hypothetical protein